MLAHGINIGWGQDCVLDPWYSLGTADMLDVAFMGLHVAQMTSPSEMQTCFDMVTTNNAKTMGLTDYGLHVGAKASLVVLDAGSAIEAIRLRAARLQVVANGKIISQTSRPDAMLSILDRPASIGRRHNT
jgi:cytosine deaminase